MNFTILDILLFIPMSLMSIIIFYNAFKLLIKDLKGIKGDKNNEI